MDARIVAKRGLSVATLGLALLRSAAADPPATSPAPVEPSSVASGQTASGSQQFSTTPSGAQPGSPLPMGQSNLPVAPPTGLPAQGMAVPGGGQPPGAMGPSAGAGAASPYSGAEPGTGAAAGGEAFQSALSAATGGITSVNGGLFPNVIGDQSPLRAIRNAQSRIPLPPPVPPPPNHAPNVPNPLKGAILAPSVRGFKISDNQSPRPQDRVFFSFDYFNNLNKTLDRHFQSPVINLRAYRYVWGFEKTFNEGMGSVGVRLPLDTLTADSGIKNPYSTPTTTALGDLSLYAKYILAQNLETGSLLSVGLQVTPPTGPKTFANSQYIQSIHALDIQPFVGYILAFDRLYLQGFSSLSVPGNSSDVTLIYNDLVLGYYVYRDRDPSQFLTGIIPSFETHINTPITHRDPYNRNDIGGTPDVVNLTAGLNFEFHRRTFLTFGLVSPVTGPKPFDLEALVLLNVLFGRSRSQGTPPVVAGG
jgi:hypothetical protein